MLLKKMKGKGKTRPRRSRRRVLRLDAEVTLTGVSENGGEHYAHLKVVLPSTIQDDRTGERTPYTQEVALVSPVSKRDYDLLRERYEEAERAKGETGNERISLALKGGSLVFKISR
jgi:hypothetical protein